jgi:maleylacetoacetate isomerase
MKLYTYFRSSAAYRVRIALNIKGLSYEAVPRQLARGEQRASDYLQLNPQGLVPLLVDGEATISQSLAIIEYLEETHPEPPLLPESAAARARVRSLALAVACDIHPLNNLRVLNYLRGPMAQADAAVKAWYRHWVAAGLQALESEAARARSDGEHLLGSQVTIADICLVPQMYNARRFECDVAPYPRLRKICAHLEALPAFARAAPEVQPDAVA